MTGQLSNGASDVVDAATRVAGTVAARGRGDIDGARELLASFGSHEELASGALLVAELALQALSDSNGEPLDDCVELLNLRLLSLRG